MRLTKRQLRKAIRKVIVESVGNKEICIEKCLAAIPPMMKQMCQMNMAHMVTNDIYHLCVPICNRWKCDPDEIAQEVEDRLCGRR